MLWELLCAKHRSKRLRYSSGKKKKAELIFQWVAGPPSVHLQEVTLTYHTVVCVNGDLRNRAVHSLCNRTQLTQLGETDNKHR